MKVIFSDESQIYICQVDDARTFVWLCADKIYNDHCQVKEKKKRQLNEIASKPIKKFMVEIKKKMVHDKAVRLTWVLFEKAGRNLMKNIAFC